MKRSLHYTLQTRRQRGSMIIIQASALMLIALILLMAVPMVRDRLSDHQENDKCVLQGREAGADIADPTVVSQEQSVPGSARSKYCVP